MGAFDANADPTLLDIGCKMFVGVTNSGKMGYDGLITYPLFLMLSAV
jgi:hypothetical protein